MPLREPPHRGPTVTRDNPGQRCKGGDRRWSRYERPVDAVDLTEYAGTRARTRALLSAIIARVGRGYRSTMSAIPGGSGSLRLCAIARNLDSYGAMPSFVATRRSQ